MIEDSGGPFHRMDFGKERRVNEPSAGKHQGGEVSAPVFSAVVGGALRLLAIEPDRPINAPDDIVPAPTRAGVRTAALK